MTTLNAAGQRLVSNLNNASKATDADHEKSSRSQKVNVVGAGASLTAAYEQLRNAAENTEEHLLLQSAIRRFYRQLFVSRDEQTMQDSGNELIVELTFAGYVANDSFTKSRVDEVTRVARDHYKLYEKLLRHKSISADTATGWTLDTLSAQVESMLSDHQKDIAFVDFANNYYTEIIPISTVASRKSEREEFGASLFIAIHKALLKSNTAVSRYSLMHRYQITARDTDQYILFNQKVDALLRDKLTDRLYRIVDRQGAPLRIIRRMIEVRSDFVKLLGDREIFLDAFEQQVNKEYYLISQRVNRAIVRSVIFLIITKVLIGVAVEVPYDYWAHDQIIWTPLIVNLLFPPLYMVALRATHALPGEANTLALVDRIDSMLYGEKTIIAKKQLAAKSYGPIFSAMYATISLLVFGAVMWVLLMLNFTLVHIAIFLVFISAASFLGFRLSRLIRELEIVRSKSNGFTFLRDVIYLPFVVVGQWMSDKYSQVNIVTTALDMLIELPMKTILRLIRQWGAFIDDRKDRI